MPPSLETDCVGCGRRLPFPYHHLGRRLACPGCGRSVALDVPGELPPAPGDWLTYRQFELLLAYARHRALLAPALEAWLACEVRASLGGAVQLVRGGHDLPLEEAHEILQSDPRHRAALHGLASTLWGQGSPDRPGPS